MLFTDETKQVIQRRLPAEKIKTRQGKGNMKFDYISADTVIELLNEAFDYNWSSRIVNHARYDDTIVVGVEIEVTRGNEVVIKQQFGSCQITAGLAIGDAFKGAASDALKKAATHLGIGLELYHDDEVVPGVQLPKQSHRPNTPAAPRVPVSPPAKPRIPSAPISALPRPVVPGNPFEDSSAPTPEAIRKPAAPPKPKTNPFDKKSVAGAVSGPTATQVSALSNIANRKNMSHAELIALAGVVDAQGNPKTDFDSLQHDEAIQVIRASQS